MNRFLRIALLIAVLWLCAPGLLWGTPTRQDYSSDVARGGGDDDEPDKTTPPSSSVPNHGSVAVQVPTRTPVESEPENLIMTAKRAFVDWLFNLTKYVTWRR